MYVTVNDVRLWFDVEGVELVPDGSTMRRRPSVVLLHGGPGSYDHSYFKPDFSRLAAIAQVIYLDLPGHGRSSWGDPASWTFEACADDLRGFCDALGLARPIIFGHSLGGLVAAAYAARHPDHPGALVLQSTTGRFDVARVVDGFRRGGGERAAQAAARFYGGDLTDFDAFRTYCRPLFGRWVLGDDERGRIITNPALVEPGLARMRAFDVLGQLDRVRCPVLVSTGGSDVVMQVADARDLVVAMPHAEMWVMEGAGHFPWKEDPDAYWPHLLEFVARQTVG